MTSSSPEPSFLSHRHMEFALVADLDHLRALADGLGMTDFSTSVEQARSSIAAHRFSIAVVGEFKRGKSTFINALLGKEILPADIAPASATINRVTYGLKPGVSIVFRDGAREEVGVGQLAAYVTKLTPEARAMAATITEAIIDYPVPFCKNNVDIIDTPGLGDDAAMNAVTMGVLPQVDAAILMVLATAPFSQSEAEFLEQLLVEYGLGSVIVVVTAIDRLRRQDDRDRVLLTVAERIEERTREHAVKRFGCATEACDEYLRRVGAPRVFGVSGGDALAAKLDGDEALLAESRFPAFESFLERFLTEESGLVALKTHAERLGGFATVLRREIAARLASPAGALDPVFQESIEAFLRSLEWLAQDARSECDAQRRQAQSEMDRLLQPLAQDLVQTAGTSLTSATATVEDLDPPRSSACMRAWCVKVTEEVNTASAAKVPAFLAAMRVQLKSAMMKLLPFGTAFDRVMSHVCEPGMLPASGATAPPSLVERFGGTNGFDQAQAAEAAVARLFLAPALRERKAITATLAVASSWDTGVNVQPMAATGPKFARKAVDLVRVEKFKFDLRSSLAAAFSQHLQTTANARKTALERLVAEAFTALGQPIETALDEIRGQRSRLQIDQQRRIASREHERQRLERMDSEVAAIQTRARDLARQLAAIQFRVVSSSDSVAGL